MARSSANSQPPCGGRDVAHYSLPLLLNYYLDPNSSDARRTSPHVGVGTQGRLEALCRAGERRILRVCQSDQGRIGLHLQPMVIDGDSVVLSGDRWCSVVLSGDRW